jgi:hypothetical protein
LDDTKNVKVDVIPNNNRKSKLYKLKPCIKMLYDIKNIHDKNEKIAAKKCV